MKGTDLVRTLDVRNKEGRVVGTKDVVTYEGLLSKAHDEGLTHVETELVQIPTDENGRTAIAKVVIETGKGRFAALGDASPENVNAFIAPHLIRMAETRAKARALRDAVNIGIVSFEELDGEEPELREPAGGSGGANDDKKSTATLRQKPSTANSVPMTEAQRRYLFRIVAGQGMQGEVAEGYLVERAGVGSLKEITKADATTLIDQLLAEDGSRAGAQR